MHFFIHSALRYAMYTPHRHKPNKKHLSDKQVTKKYKATKKKLARMQ